MRLISILRDIKNIKSGRKELREFGLVMGVALPVLALLLMLLFKKPINWYKISIVSALFIGLGLALPILLKPIHKIWMAIAVVMGFFMSRLILTLLFYGVITPIGLLTRLLGKDILGERITREKRSYWHQRPAAMKSKESYENQY